MARARVLLADDHVVVAQGLSRLLADDFDLVGIVGDGQAMVEAVRTLQPELVVADVSMPVLGGLDALRRIQAEGLDAKVIFLTMHADAQLATEALRAGASGYLLKQAAGEELITALQEVLRGRVYLTPLITRDVLQDLLAPATRPAAPGAQLTARQVEVLRLIVEGRTMKEAAATLHLSVRTVESYKYDMMRALGVETTAELIHYAIQHGLTAA
jgi:DNA-binding NarL/FixJ family response regulator